MATLAILSEDSNSKFDVVHMGEDLIFLQDGYVYLSTHLVLKAEKNCRKFKTFQIAYHGKVCGIHSSKFLDDPSKYDGITMKNDKFIIYNETFLDPEHPSNKGFEGSDFSCRGRKVSFDDYDEIYVPKDDEFDVKLVDNYESYALIRFEFQNEISANDKVCLRIGFLLEPTSGKVNRFLIYPPEINHYFHFYTKKGLGEKAISFLNEMNQDNKIMNIRLKSPKRSIPTCDFYFMVKDEYIEGLLAPTKGARMPFSKNDFRNGDYLNYHLYPEDMPYMIPTNTHVDEDNSVKVPILKFGENKPLLLRIDRTDRSIFYSIFPTFIGIFGTSIAINIEYNKGFQITGIFVLTVVLTIIIILIMNKAFTKTKNIN